MHEFSIIASLIERCEELACMHQAKRVLEVYVEIGERSGVDSKLFASAFEEYKIGSVCEEASLHLTWAKIEIFCETCCASFVPKELNYTSCVYCQGSQTRIIKGNEMLLLRLEME